MPEEKVITPPVVEGEKPSEQTKTDVKEEFVKNEVNFSAALKEKNQKIQETKARVVELEQELERQKSENDLLRTFNEPTSESDTEISNLNAKIKELETFKNSLEETSKEQDRNKKREEISNYCNNLKTNPEYADFDETKVLLSLYERTGGILNSLSQIEDEYLLLKTKESREAQKLEEARKKASTESPSNVSTPSEKTPQNVEEGFDIYKRQKK
jgi:chromosome condensin MukBEF ATPase and DNA-binding subunit MukB